MKPLKTDDPLDTLLREQNAYIDDNGFSARVISALPLRRVRPLSSRTFLLTMATIGAALAAWWLPWENLPAFNWAAFLSFRLHVLLPWILELSVMGSLIWAIITAVQMED